MYFTYLCCLIFFSFKCIEASDEQEAFIEDFNSFPIEQEFNEDAQDSDSEFHQAEEEDKDKINTIPNDEDEYYHCKPPPTSCQDHIYNYPKSRSGYYSIIAKGKKIRVYCHMGYLCGVYGGWTRLDYLNMRLSTKCPTGFQLYVTRGIRHCGRPPSHKGGCSSKIISSYGVKYSHVCGKVLGYEYGNPDAFHYYGRIDQVYLDGVSITYGSPPKHVFSFAAGNRETIAGPYACPCNSGSSNRPPLFVGNNYYCESGITHSSGHEFAVGDTLWDGKLCRHREASCCSRSNIFPRFKRDLGTVTSDSLQLRVCTNEGTHDENVSIGEYDIFVK